MGLTEILFNLLHADKGRDVRQSLHDGVKIATDTANKVKEAQEQLDNKFEEQIKNMTLESPSDAEIVDARMDIQGRAYDTVGDRIDFVESKADNALEQANVAKTNAEDAVKQVTTLSVDLKNLTSIGRIAIKLITITVKAKQTGTFNVPLRDSPDISVGAKNYDAYPVGIIGTYVSTGGVMNYAKLNSPDLLSNTVQFELAEAPTKDVIVQIYVLYIGG